MLNSTPIRVLSFVVLGLLAGTMLIPLWSIVATAFSSKFASPASSCGRRRFRWKALRRCFPVSISFGHCSTRSCSP